MPQYLFVSETHSWITKSQPSCSIYIVLIISPNSIKSDLRSSSENRVRYIIIQPKILKGCQRSYRKKKKTIEKHDWARIQSAAFDIIRIPGISQGWRI